MENRKSFILREKGLAKIRNLQFTEEKNANLAFSEPPSADGSKPGVFYLNLSDMKLMPSNRFVKLMFSK